MNRIYLGTVGWFVVVSTCLVACGSATGEPTNEGDTAGAAGVGNGGRGASTGGDGGAAGAATSGGAGGSEQAGNGGSNSAGSGNAGDGGSGQAGGGGSDPGGNGGSGPGGSGGSNTAGNGGSAQAGAGGSAQAGAGGSAQAGAGGSGGAGGSAQGGEGGTAGSGGGAGGNGGSGPVNDPLGPAAGVTLSRVDLYQAVRRPLMVDGQAVQSDIPIIAGRPALVRLYFRKSSAYDGRPVTARFTLEGSAPLTVTSNGTLGADPTDAALGSTFNFELPGDVIGSTLSFSAELLQDGGRGGASARYPSNGFANVTVVGRANTLRVRLVPYAYGADGSNRVPDTSAAAVEKMRQRLFSMFPVSDVEISVRAPVQWSGTISPSGSGWSQVLQNTQSVRNRDIGSNSDVYYYGIFNPASSFASYCRGGCVSGLANTNTGSGSASLRFAVGIGYPDSVASTMAHELGHSHGRLHAPCAPGGQIDGVDGSFPHQGARLGAWGYDLTTERLVDPNTFTDIMGYCRNQFVSDYTYQALHTRSQRVNLLSLAPVRYQVLWLDGAGNARLGDVMTADHALDGELVDVDVRLPDGTAARRRGHFHGFDHLEGGSLWVPLDGVATLGPARFSVAGKVYRIAR